MKIGENHTLLFPSSVSHLLSAIFYFCSVGYALLVDHSSRGNTSKAVVTGQAEQTNLLVQRTNPWPAPPHPAPPATFLSAPLWQD